MLTAIAIIAMAMASYAGSATTPFHTTDGYTTSFVKSGPTKEYLDIKMVLDEYERSINKANSCDELEDASLSFYISLMSLVDVEYSVDEEITEAEEKKLNEQMDRISNKVEALQKQWGCETESNDDDDSNEVIPTTTKEWENLLNDYEAILVKLNEMKYLDLDDDADLDKLLEFITEAQPVLERIQNSDTETLTEKQSERLDRLNDRFLSIAKSMGLIDD